MEECSAEEVTLEFTDDDKQLVSELVNKHMGVNWFINKNVKTPENKKDSHLKAKENDFESWLKSTKRTIIEEVVSNYLSSTFYKNLKNSGRDKDLLPDTEVTNLEKNVKPSEISNCLTTVKNESDIPITFSDEDILMIDSYEDELEEAEKISESNYTKGSRADQRFKGYRFPVNKDILSTGTNNKSKGNSSNKERARLVYDLQDKPQHVMQDDKLKKTTKKKKNKKVAAHDFQNTSHVKQGHYSGGNYNESRVTVSHSQNTPPFMQYDDLRTKLNMNKRKSMEDKLKRRNK